MTQPIGNVRPTNKIKCSRCGRIAPMTRANADKYAREGRPRCCGAVMTAIGQTEVVRAS